jgi:hypothetical protein
MPEARRTAQATLYNCELVANKSVDPQRRAIGGVFLTGARS